METTLDIIMLSMSCIAVLPRKKEIASGKFKAIASQDQKPLDSEAMKISKGTYLTCLFLLIADKEHYGGIKAARVDNYLGK